MKLLVKSLKLTNFKGMKEFRLMFDDTETNVYGANGTGKTTVADAFFFIFTGTDSAGTQAKEWVQTLDENNEKVHKVYHEAEVILDVDGDTITLARRVAEKWTKPRGQKEEVLAETLDYDYFIDGVSTPAKQFEAFITETVFGGNFTANEFVLLSNPTAFCNLPWKEQRDILYKVCGNTTDEEVIATEERFNFLTEALRHKDVETLKKALRKSISDTKDEIKAIEAVIKDRKNSLIQEYTRQDVEMEKSAKEEHMKTLQNQLNADSEKYQEIRLKQQEVIKIEKLRDQAAKDYYTKNNQAIDEAKEKLTKVETDIFNTTLKRDTCVKRIESNKQELAIIKGTTIPNFREIWNSTKNMCMQDGSTICPHCGQELIGDKLQEVISNFESKKEQDLARLKAESIRIKGDQETKKQIIESNEKMLLELDAELEKLKSNKLELNEIINSSNEIIPFDDSEFNQKLKVLQQEIVAFEQVDNSKIQEEINLANKDLQLIAIKLHKCNEYDNSLKEIKNKEAERKEKQLILADIETQMISTEDFVTTKVRMLEEKINDKFESVKFKLFKQNLKGNWEETCTALAVGSNGSLVDLKGGLANTALRVQAGIEIVKALQKHFDYYCPVFVDNRESVTELPGVEGQLVSFIVSENDKELRVK